MSNGITADQVGPFTISIQQWPILSAALADYQLPDYSRAPPNAQKCMSRGYHSRLLTDHELEPTAPCHRSRSNPTLGARAQPYEITGGYVFWRVGPLDAAG